jgi:mRNA-degrading endonuclease toxin of MazEF toxin-antitoxin module
VYIKNFDKWNIRKKRIEKKTQIPFFYTREIWRCSLGVNIGSEQDGKNDLYERPVLILKKFNKNTLLILPLTTKIAHKNYSYKISPKSYVLLSQIRLISSKRLLSKNTKIPLKSYYLIIIKFFIMLVFK